MECHTCRTKMKCYDDVNDISTRIDWLKCPKCGSWAEVEYGENGKYINKVTWKRDMQEETK